MSLISKKRPNGFRLPIRLFALVGMSVALAATVCQADQFVLFDVTFDYTKEDAENSKPSKSHFYVKDKMLNTERPKDWTAPVDYRNGTVHVRLEVIEKPAGDEPTTWSICYIPNKGQKNGYGCLGSDIYTKVGVYEKDIPMKTFWENDSIVWTEGIKQMDLVIKDNSGGSGHAHKRADAEKFFPTKVRLTLTQVSAGATYQAVTADMFPEISNYVEKRIAEFGDIPEERRQVLETLAKYIRGNASKSQASKITFVCTHNSRRSHFSQVWAQVAAAHFGLQNVETFSGGTEATAFNPRSVAALKRCGFRIETGDPSIENPHYSVRFKNSGNPSVCFSKVFDQSPNPKSGFCAVMTCSQADKSCPTVTGSELRIAIPYDDPKVADGTPSELAKYDQRCAQIAREMLYVMDKAR